MAIEIESGFSIKKNILPIIVLAVALIIALFLASSYVFMLFSSNEISAEIEEKNKSLVETPSETALKKEVSDYEGKINTFKTLINGRKKVLNVFSFLEEVCHPDVWFKNFNYDSSGGKVVINATAKDFIVMAQQLLILKQHQDVLTKITLSGMNIGENEEIGFSLDLVFAPQIFK